MNEILGIKKESLDEILQRRVPKKRIIALYIDGEVWYDDSLFIIIRTESNKLYSMYKVFPCAFVFKKEI
jgi:hypothetical protein